MSDQLGEALAWWDKEPRFAATPHQKVLVAAARNWHTLTNPTDELIERVATAIYDSEVGGEWGDWKDETIMQREMWLRTAKAALDAL